ncbi:MAG: isocitrate lyase/phosphoenolpyruvate mutase family protein [Polyangiales bacterium]
MVDQADKGRAFRALHQRKQTFILPNAWDAGSARVLESTGFTSLATTSAGFANSIGQLDGQPGRDAVLEHAAILVRATDLPISADLESGFGDSPETVAETIRAAAQVGLVGGSIEDYTGKRDEPLYPLEVAAERVRAAVEAARSLDFHFTLTARADGFNHGRTDLADTIRRLQAYQEAGADVLYAPGLRTREELKSVLAEIDRPLNVLAGAGGLAELTLVEGQALGVTRISLGDLLTSVAYGALIQAAHELKTRGTFGFVTETARSRVLPVLLRR